MKDSYHVISTIIPSAFETGSGDCEKKNVRMSNHDEKFSSTHDVTTACSVALLEKKSSVVFCLASGLGIPLNLLGIVYISIFSEKSLVV